MPGPFEFVRAILISSSLFAIEKYTRFRANMNGKIELLNSGKLFEWGEERGLLLSTINEDEFYKFLNSLQGYLKELVLGIAQTEN